ncbi:uncharacterized protein LOC107044379 [Diachasma alloeum]|uniref:uncharacterized protein LOC107044379 n=1 Tax=Diachasma alloeum TaxID=454923 RepID=UPI0007382A59|nr:uncharacterized protein LOC107044379 [Diachasma alloeum]
MESFGRFSTGSGTALSSSKNEQQTTTKDSELETEDTSSVVDSRDLRQARRRKRDSPGHDGKKLKKPKGPGTALPDKLSDRFETVENRKKSNKTSKTLPNTPRSSRRMGRSASRSDASIIRPNDKVKYAEILTKVKKDIPPDQVLGCGDKIRKTATGDMLIVLTKDSASKARVLQSSIAGLLGEDAEVLSKGPQENIEIKDRDDMTTKEQILKALCKAAGNEVQMTQDAIKSLRKAYGGTQTALVTLPVLVAKKILGDHGKIRIPSVNCRVRRVEKPVKCFKCWHYGHLATKCTSTVDRSKLCVKCSATGHKALDCTE